jgi:hypothetical protein
MPGLSCGRRVLPIAAAAVFGGWLPHVQPTPGCYELTVESWKPPDVRDSLISTPMPQLLRLENERLRSDIDIFAAHSLVEGEWLAVPFGQWWPLSADSIRIGPCLRLAESESPYPCAPPMGGYWMTVRVEDEGLKGHIDSSTDALLPDVPNRASARVVGSRVQCPS